MSIGIPFYLSLLPMQLLNTCKGKDISVTLNNIMKNQDCKRSSTIIIVNLQSLN